MGHLDDMEGETGLLLTEENAQPSENKRMGSSRYSPLTSLEEDVRMIEMQLNEHHLSPHPLVSTKSKRASRELSTPKKRKRSHRQHSLPHKKSTKKKITRRRSLSQPKKANKDSLMSFVSSSSSFKKKKSRRTPRTCSTPVDYALSFAHLDPALREKRKKKKKKVIFRPRSSLERLLASNDRTMLTSSFKHTTLGFHSFPNRVISLIFEYCDFLGVAPRAKATSFSHATSSHTMIMHEPQQALLYPSFYRAIEKTMYKALSLSERAAPSYVYDTRKPVQVQLVDYFTWTYPFDDRIAKALVPLCFGKRHGEVLPLIRHLSLRGLLFPSRRLVQSSSKFSLPRFSLDVDAGYPHRVFWKSLPIFGRLLSMSMPMIVSQASLRFLRQPSLSPKTLVHVHINNHGHSMLFDANTLDSSRFAEQYLWHPSTRDDAILDALPYSRLQALTLDWNMASSSLSRLVASPLLFTHLRKLSLPHCILPPSFFVLLERASPRCLSLLSLSLHRVDEYALFPLLKKLPSVRHLKLMLHRVLQPPPIPLLFASLSLESLRVVRSNDTSVNDAMPLAIESPYQFDDDSLASAFFESLRMRCSLQRLSLYQVYFHRSNMALLVDLLMVLPRLSRVFFDMHLAVVPFNLVHLSFSHVSSLSLHVSSKDFLHWQELDEEGASFLSHASPSLSLHAFFESLLRSPRKNPSLTHLSIAWDPEAGLPSPSNLRSTFPSLSSFSRSVPPEDLLDERSSSCSCLAFQS